MYHTYIHVKHTHMLYIDVAVVATRTSIVRCICISAIKYEKKNNNIYGGGILSTI